MKLILWIIRFIWGLFFVYGVEYIFDYKFNMVIETLIFLIAIILFEVFVFTIKKSSGKVNDHM